MSLCESSYFALTEPLSASQDKSKISSHFALTRAYRSPKSHERCSGSRSVQVISRNRPYPVATPKPSLTSSPMLRLRMSVFSTASRSARVRVTYLRTTDSKRIVANPPTSWPVSKWSDSPHSISFLMIRPSLMSKMQCGSHGPPPMRLVGQTSSTRSSARFAHVWARKVFSASANFTGSEQPSSRFAAPWANKHAERLSAVASKRNIVLMAPPTSRPAEVRCFSDWPWRIAPLQYRHSGRASRENAWPPQTVFRGSH